MNKEEDGILEAYAIASKITIPRSDIGWAGLAEVYTGGDGVDETEELSGTTEAKSVSGEGPEDDEDVEDKE